MMHVKKLILQFIVIMLCFISSPVFAQIMGGGEGNPDLHTNQQSLEMWQDLRFGMFIHWGPVTLRGTEIGWSRGREVAIDDYDSLYREFNPILFDAAEWVRIAREAGMKYLIITAKHHDGFALWDTQYSDYNIMNTPYGKDILKQLAEECRKQGIKFGIYYSIADWYHPDHPGKYPDENYWELARSNKQLDADQRESMSKYVSFMKNQLKEIIDNYEPFVLWFDGEWEWPWTHKMGMDLYAFVKEQDSTILINNRVDKGREGMAGMTISDKYAGDFGTPEQEIGNYNIQTPWESCITIGRQWAWKPNDELKSTKELKHTLVNTVGGNGNLLLNVGPMMDGRIEQRQIRKLSEVGEWLDENGSTIYGTRGGPYMPTETFVSTQKDNKIFLHMLKNPGSEIILPVPDEVKIQDANLVNSSLGIDFQMSKGELHLSIPEELPNPGSIIIELELNKEASELGTIKRIRY